MLQRLHLRSLQNKCRMRVYSSTGLLPVSVGFYACTKPTAVFRISGCQRSNVTNSNEDYNLPNEAEAVVIGAGSVGCSTAYHLSKLLKGNVVLLEKHKLTSGTTWHTAGILWCFRPSESETLMQIQTRDLVSEILPTVTGDSAGWTQTGGLHTFKSSEDHKSFIQNLTFAKNFDMKFTEVRPSDIPDLHPLVNINDIHVAVYSPGDGLMDPFTLCMSYVKAAVKFGAKVVENCTVTNILTKDDDFGFRRVVGVETNQGTIKTNNVINCAGAWAPYIAEMVGVQIPQLTFKHAYVVTESIPGIQGTPIVKDHGSVYIKPQGSALHFGGYEMNPHLVQNLPKDFSFGLYDLDWEVFQPHYEGAVNRIPQIEKAGIRSTVCGPESFTPDGRPNIGESLSVRGFYVGCGFNSGGMMLGGGAGRQLAHWVYNGKPEIDLFNCDIRRYPSNFHNYNKWLYESCHGKFAKRYGLVYKYDHSLSGRNQRLGPLHEIHRKRGALFGSKNGFERAAYYVVDNGGKPITDLEVLPYDFYGCYGNKKHRSYPYCDEVLKDCTYEFPTRSHRLIGRECLTCRTSAAIFDNSSMSKYFLSGPDMNLVMRRVFTRDVTHAGPRQFLYSLLLNQDGGIEGDAIVTKRKNKNEENGYYITTATSAEQYCLTHIERIIADSKWNCKIDNITEQGSIMSVQGPNSAKWLASVIEDTALPKLRYGEWNDVRIAGKQAILGRLSFVGELGYEIHCHRDDAIQIHNALMDKAHQYQACMAGYRAMESLSCETGFHHWPHSIKSSDNPIEAGLIKFCDNTDVYIGANAIRKLRDADSKKRLFYFTIECDVPLYGEELILQNDQFVGYLRTAVFAYALNCNFGCGYVESPAAVTNSVDGNFKIERMGVQYPAECHVLSPFDPKYERMKGRYCSKQQNMLSSLFEKL